MSMPEILDLPSYALSAVIVHFFSLELGHVSSCLQTWALKFLDRKCPCRPGTPKSVEGRDLTVQIDVHVN